MFFKGKKDHNENAGDADTLSPTIQFEYELSGTGKASGALRCYQNEITFEVSNSGNPLSDLLKGMIKLIYEPAHIWGEDNISWIDWYNEEGAIKWVLSTTDGKSLHVKIIGYEDIFDESTASVQINCTFGLLDFYYAVVHSLDELIKKNGLLNYEQQWQTNAFPLTYFLQLKKHLIEKAHWIPSNTKLGILSDEIDFLLA